MTSDSLPQITPSCSTVALSKWWHSRSMKRCAMLLSLALTVVILWSIIFDRWRPSDWGTPVDYSSDALFYMGMIKHAENGDLLPFGYIHSDKVGAPFNGNLNDFPLAERPILWLGGMLSRLIGLPGAVNILVISAHIIAALSFYTASRLWRISKPFSWSLALSYAFIPYSLIVSNSQLPFLFYGLLPLQLYFSWYISSTPDLSLKDRRLKLALIVALLSGLVQIYLIIPFIFLNTFAILRRIINRNSHLILATAPLLVTSITTTLTLSSYIIFWVKNGGTSAIFRHYNHLEIGGLKFIDLFLPGRHHAFGFFNDIYQRYIAEGGYTSSEAFRAYLGLISILGIVILTIRSLQRAASRGTIPPPALIASFFFIYASFGGLNSLLSLLSEVYLIRTMTRYACVISTIGLLYFGLAVSRWTKRWCILPRITLALLLSSISLVDQARPTYFRYHNSASNIKEKIKYDRDLALRLESEVPSEGMIFMLPVMGFPEAIPIHRLTDYELIRPFLYSTNLRFSYGSNKGRPNVDWQTNILQYPAEKLISNLEDYGFSGILINQLAYPDGGESLIGSLVEKGSPPSFEQRNEWIFIPLNPATSLKSPALAFTFSKSWFPREGSNQHWWHWSGEVDSSEIYIYSKIEGTYNLKFNLRSISPRIINISLNGNLLKDIKFDYGTHIPLSISADLHAGKNTLTISSNEPPILSAPSFSSSHIAFAIEDFYIETLEGHYLDFLGNWYSPEGTPDDQWRWAGDLGGTINIVTDKDGSYRFSGLISTISAREIYILLNGEYIKKLEFTRADKEAISIELSLKKGENALSFSTDQPAIQPSNSDPRYLAFYVRNPKLEPIE